MSVSFQIGLKISNLSAVRGYRTLFRELSLELEPGALLELRGPNGAGKSTFLRLLAGISRPADGTLTWTGTEDALEDRHYLGHLDAVKPQETVREQAEFWARYFCVHSSRETARDALKKVGLGGRLQVAGRGLSAGQRRRLALTRLIMAPRAVWLLDEPLAALDTDGQALVRSLIEDHRKCGGLVIAAMHGDGFDDVTTLNIGDFAPTGDIELAGIA